MARSMALRDMMRYNGGMDIAKKKKKKKEYFVDEKGKKWDLDQFDDSKSWSK